VSLDPRDLDAIANAVERGVTRSIVKAYHTLMTWVGVLLLVYVVWHWGWTILSLVLGVVFTLYEWLTH
jgi:hypothetical protein